MARNQETASRVGGNTKLNVQSGFRESAENNIRRVNTLE